MRRIYALLCPPSGRSARFRGGVLLLSLAAAWTLRWALDPWLGATASYLTFFPAIVFCAWLGGTCTGLASTILASLLSAWFFLDPVGSLAVFAVADRVSLGVFFIEGVLISLVCGMVHQALRSAQCARDDLGQSESALETQRALLKTIIDAVPAMVAYIDRDERFVLHNRQYETWLGLRHDDIHGKTVREVLGDARYPEAQPHLQAALAGNNVRYEKTLLAPHKNRDAMVTFRPDIRPDGRVAGVVIHAFDITESRRMAVSVSRSEKRYYTLVNATASIVWIASPEGRVSEANGLVEFTGRAVEGEITAFWTSLIHPDDREKAHGSWERVSRTERSWDCVYRLLAADGRYHHVHSRGAAVVNADGQVEEWIGTVHDIHQRIEAEESLRLKEAELKLVVDTMPALVAYVDKDLRYGLANRAYHQWFGIDPESMRGRHITEVLGQDAYAAIRGKIQRVLAGETVRYESLMPYLHGEPRWVSAIFTPHRGQDGCVPGYFELVLDISERKKAEQQLADLLDRYRFLADAMPQSVWTTDAAGEQDYASRRWIDYTGVPVTDVSRWPDIIHPEDLEPTRRRWQEAVTTGKPYRMEHRLRDRFGNYHWFLSLALARRDDTGAIVQWVGTATNIDEQRHAYAELTAARAELKRHADDLENVIRLRTARLEEVNAELEAFTYSASHDLRVPLRHIRGFTEAILADAGATLSEENQTNLRLILSSARRMDTLICDLLAYSRLSRDEIVLVPLALDAVVADVLADHRATIESRHAEILVHGPLPPVMADRVGLQQVLANLVSNALKFVAPGVAPRVVIRAEPRGARVRLWVEDNGIGIEPRYHEDIFTLFRRLHGAKTYAGTGIGLSLVRKGITRMGGECGVESAPGAGSRFWLDFQSAPIG
jgi:PAS domain S-box-containing protein